MGCTKHSGLYGRETKVFIPSPLAIINLFPSTIPLTYPNTPSHKHSFQLHFPIYSQYSTPTLFFSALFFLLYFFLPVCALPSFAPGVAMWLVSYAREMGVATVDVSGSLRAVHMMATKFGNNESGGKYVSFYSRFFFFDTL